MMANIASPFWSRLGSLPKEHVQRSFVPQNPRFLLFPRPCLAVLRDVKSPEEVCENETHFQVGKALPDAAAGTDGERVKGRVIGGRTWGRWRLGWRARYA